jgi:3-oxoacyl-[acyl-carrier-protein] synthase II
VAEVRAMQRVFGERALEIPVSATKGAHGHLLGGTGALEAAFTVLALHHRIAPPTINVTEQDPEAPLSISSQPVELGSGPQLAISNSFGFGGHNAVAAFRSI